LDMYTLFGKILFDAFGFFGYGIDFDTLRGGNKDLLEALYVISESMIQRQGQPFKWLWYLPTRNNKRIDDAVRLTRSFIEELMESRKKSSSESEKDSTSNLLDALLSKEGVSDDEVRDNIAMFLLGSFDTTSNTLSYILYFLAQHPDLQDDLLQEIDSLDIGGTNTSSTLLHQASLLDRVCKESIRLLPTAYAIPRTPTQALSSC